MHLTGKVNCLLLCVVPPTRSKLVDVSCPQDPLVEDHPLGTLPIKVHVHVIWYMCVCESVEYPCLCGFHSVLFLF